MGGIVTGPRWTTIDKGRGSKEWRVLFATLRAHDRAFDGSVALLLNI
jgi:hypothetical protein